MRKILLIRFILGWPSLYRSQSNKATNVSALEKQRKIVEGMMQRKAFVHTEPVRRY